MLKEHFHTPTGHYTNVTVAIGQNMVERRLLRQTTNRRRLGKRAHILLLFQVEVVHLIRQTHHLRHQQKDASKVK